MYQIPQAVQVIFLVFDLIFFQPDFHCIFNHLLSPCLVN